MIGLGLSIPEVAVRGGGLPSWLLAPGGVVPDVDIDFANNRAWTKTRGLVLPASLLTTARASVETGLLSTSSAGASFTTFGNNAPALIPGAGLQVYEARTNFLANPGAPATQTTGSLGVGSYTLWVNGAGSATVSAGTATGTGFGTATQGSPVTFSVSVAGTVVATVSGSLNQFQLENGTFPTPYMPGASRAADVINLTIPPTFGGAYSIAAWAMPTAPAAFGTNQELVSAFLVNGATSFDLYRGSVNGFANSFDRVASSFLTNLSTTLWSPSTAGKLAASVTPGSHIVVFNSGTPVTGSPASVPAAASANIGSRSSSDSFWNGRISRLAIWATTALSSGALQAVTT